MNFLLKIVEGPNRGAEIAIVDGVAVTLGKADDCDIVLADPTLPAEPVKIEAADGSVSVDGVQLVPFTVKTVGATSFAVGPSDTPWGELKWPEKETEEAEHESARETDGDGRESEKAPPADAGASAAKKRRGCGCGCLAAILLLAALAALAWLFRADPRVEKARSSAAGIYGRVAAEFSGSSGDSASGSAVSSPAADLAAVAAKYGVTLVTADGSAKVSGNFKTRRERLAATAEAYDAQPGVELDFSDDESFRMAADDALFTLTEGALKVVAATNRAVSLSGVSPSPSALRKTLEALNGDLPKLRAVDVSGVAIDAGAVRDAADAGQDDGQPASEAPPRLAPKTRVPMPDLPVCGILATPYPCLVLKNGERLLEGAAIGANVILKIEADSVTLTNSTGRFTWKP